ncbi:MULTISPECIES: polysaccharide deacetylase family protein [Bacteroides]|uniref:polysaccharide deacetylase family protein n=1 Tax=Bacteroides TaxID=816 RepID=UPI00095D01B3|nr:MULTISPECIES: polysaccharide deacetylase family protein [Bacteroides]OKZ17647.1 MAG: chitin deacetylase [Bacteroides sp. 43_46]
MRTFLTILLCTLFYSGFSFGTDWNVYVAKYRHDKVCAISYTFDDGLAEHYTLAAPQLEQRGFRGTFFVNGSKVNKDERRVRDTTRVTWPQLKEMVENGHEISNHGWAHRNFAKFPFDVLKEDIMKNDSAIYANVGIMPRTYAYPNNTKQGDAMEFVARNRVGTRLKQRSVGSKRTARDLQKWLETLIRTGDWGVGMTHGLTYGYDAFRNPQLLWEHWDQVKANEDKVWVGTFCEVVSYLKEKEAIHLRVTEKKNKLYIVPELSLDKKLFTEPLTMVIEGKTIKKLSVRQGKKKLPVQLRSDKAFFDFDPFGDEIIVTIR